MLRVTRDVGFGIELRRGRLEVSVDGKNVGSLANHETVETPLESGRRTLRIRKGRYSSRDHSFDVADGEVVNFRCHGTRIWPMYVGSIVVPNLAISLTRSKGPVPNIRRQNVAQKFCGRHDGDRPDSSVRWFRSAPGTPSSPPASLLACA